MFPLDPNAPQDWTPNGASGHREFIPRDPLYDGIVARQNGDALMRPITGRSYDSWEDATADQARRNLDAVDPRDRAAIQEANDAIHDAVEAFAESEWPTLTDRARMSLEAYALRPVTPRTKRDWYEPEL